MGVGGQRHAPAALPPGERPGTHCIEGWVDPRAGLDGCGKSQPPPTGIRSPDRPARSELLYGLSYRGHLSLSLNQWRTVVNTNVPGLFDLEDGVSALLLKRRRLFTDQDGVTSQKTRMLVPERFCVH